MLSEARDRLHLEIEISLVIQAAELLLKTYGSSTNGCIVYKYANLQLSFSKNLFSDAKLVIDWNGATVFHAVQLSGSCSWMLVRTTFGPWRDTLSSRFEKILSERKPARLN